MEKKKYTVVLKGKYGDVFALKIDSVSGGENEVVVDVKYALKKGVGTLYLIGDEIAKTEVYNDKTEYKVAFCAKKEFVCVYETDRDFYVGSNGKTPPVPVLEKRILNFENSLSLVEESKDREEEKADGNFLAETMPNDKDEESFVENNCDEKIVEEELGQGEGNAGTDCAVQSENADEGRVETDGKNPFILDDYIHFDGTNFYLAVKPQLDEIFICYPPEKELNDLVPNSKWVHINSDGDYYVVGLVYNGTVVSHVCYGIPSPYYVAPPEEIADVAVWLPADVSAPDGKGYWVIYQSAVDGKCVR